VKIIHSDDNRLHFPQGELYGGELVTPFERPSRVEFVLNELKLHAASRTFLHPANTSPAPVRKLHDARYLKFLETAWDEWMAAGYRGEIIPTTFPARRMQLREPKQIDGKVGYYALAVETAMTAGTWEAAKALVPWRRQRSGLSRVESAPHSPCAARRAITLPSTCMAATAS
jgi:acetoin utilization deacetylase AcuC-like enzyme